MKSFWNRLRWSSIFGWEYRVARDLDLMNVYNFPKCRGVAKINDAAAKGWEPCMVIQSDALAYRVHMLFRRRKLFPKTTSWDGLMTLKRDDDFDAHAPEQPPDDLFERWWKLQNPSDRWNAQSQGKWLNDRALMWSICKDAWDAATNVKMESPNKTDPRHR